MKSSRTDANSYRLVYSYALYENAYKAYNELLTERDFRVGNFVPLFLRHDLFQDMEDWQIELFLNHAQAILENYSLYPTFNSLFDSNYELNDEDYHSVKKILSKITYSNKRKYHTLQRDIFFLLSINFKEIENAFSLAEFWDIWKENRSNVYRKYLFYTNNSSRLMTIQEILIAYKFFDGLNNELRIKSFFQKDFHEIDFIQQALSGEFFQLSTNVKNRRLFLEAESIIARFFRKYYSQKGKDPLRLSLSKSSYRRVPMITENILKYCKNQNMSHDQILSYIKNMNIEEIVCRSRLNLLKAEETKKNEVLKFVRDNIDNFSTGNSIEFFYKKGFFGYDFLKEISYPTIDADAIVKEKVSQALQNMKMDWTDFQLHCDGGISDTNYIIALLFNNLDAQDAFNLIDSHVSKKGIPRSQLPTVKQWERFVENLSSEEMKGMPIQIVFDLSSRKRK